MKLAVFSDIHYTENYPIKRLKVIEESLRANHPDYICIIGDLIDQGDVLENSQCRDYFYDWLRRLSLIAPIMIALGNHDMGIYHSKWYHHYPKEIIEEIGSMPNIYVLNNRSIIKESILFLGYTLPFSYYDIDNKENVEPYIDDIDTQFKNIMQNNKFSILLCHTPIYVTNDMVCKTNVLKSCQLILSGHMHNGIVPFSGLGHYGLISPWKKFFPKYARGYFQLDKRNYVVSGGVIAFSKVSPRIFHCFNCFFPIHIDYLMI